MTAVQRPLAGVRVADFGQLTAGANTSAMLADLGADVIKIESASYMDLFRHWNPGGEPEWWNKSPQFHFTNRNKRGVSLDLKTSKGRRLALDLIARCDLVVENYSRGVLERLGLDHATVSVRNPRIVYASITSQGETGPRRMHRTYGSTLDAMGGLASLTGYPDDEPLISGGDFNYPDQVVSLLATGLIIGALRDARRTGRGGHLDISQREVVSFLIGEEIGAAAAEPARIPERRGNAVADTVLQQCFRAKDRRWVAVTVDGADSVARMCEIVGIEADLADSVGTWIEGRSAAEAITLLRERGIVAAVVNNGHDLLAAPDLLGASLIEADGMLYKGMPYAIEGAPFTIERGAPSLGADTADVLHTVLGLDPGTIDDLYAAGVTGNDPKGAL